jgi:ATP-binding cassette, subfamily G (WHITE), member 2, SNQ2
LDSIFFLFIFTSAISMKGWFRAVAAAFESEATASSFAGLFLLLLVLYTYVPPIVSFPAEYPC